jgi:Flp pilus assembly protein TadB
MEPEYVEVFIKSPKGPWLIATAVLLQIIGGIWVWRILKTSS